MHPHAHPAEIERVAKANRWSSATWIGVGALVASWCGGGGRRRAGAAALRCACDLSRLRARRCGSDVLAGACACSWHELGLVLDVVVLLMGSAQC